MTDRELLELAAKAAGIRFHAGCEYSSSGGLRTLGGWWNPLAVNGDAFELAVRLRLDICRPSSKHAAVCVWVDHLCDFIEENEGADTAAATRRAIVRAAAEIGRTL